MAEPEPYYYTWVMLSKEALVLSDGVVDMRANAVEFAERKLVEKTDNPERWSVWIDGDDMEQCMEVGMLGMQGYLIYFLSTFEPTTQKVVGPLIYRG